MCDYSIIKKLMKKINELEIENLKTNKYTSKQMAEKITDLLRSQIIATNIKEK